MLRVTAVAPHFSLDTLLCTHTLVSFSVSPSAMFLAAALPRSVSRGALSHGSRLLVGRQQARSATASRGFSSAFQPTPGARKSAAVEHHHDDWENEAPPASKVNPACVVNSHTEWDPLEEVIVGRVDDATIPEWHVSGKAVWPAKHWGMFKDQAGESFPSDLVSKGERGGQPEAATCATRMSCKRADRPHERPDADQPTRHELVAHRTKVSTLVALVVRSSD